MVPGKRLKTSLCTGDPGLSQRKPFVGILIVNDEFNRQFSKVELTGFVLKWKSRKIKLAAEASESSGQTKTSFGEKLMLGLSYSGA